MSSGFIFGLEPGKLTKLEEKRREKIAEQYGCDFYCNDTTRFGDAIQSWFVGPAWWTNGCDAMDNVLAATWPERITA